MSAEIRCYRCGAATPPGQVIRREAVIARVERGSKTYGRVDLCGPCADKEEVEAAKERRSRNLSYFFTLLIPLAILLFLAWIYISAWLRN